jgi:hypothetical protein
MVIKGIFCGFFIFLALNIQSQENGTNMLELGFVNPGNYIINGTEQINHIQFMEVMEKGNGFYQIEIHYKHNDKSEYWNFKIINIKKAGKIIDGQLVEIGCEDTSGMWYFDDKSNGEIKIDLKNKIVIIEIVFRVHNDPESNYKIIWENYIENNNEMKMIFPDYLPQFNTRGL